MKGEYNEIYKNKQNFNAFDIVAFLNDNQQYMKVMKDEILKNYKKENNIYNTK